MRDPETGNSKGFAFINFASFEASDAAMDAMNGQYLCNRPISVSYAFKKDSKGERHGSAAERLLAAQNPLSHADRPHQLFADAPVPVTQMMQPIMNTMIPQMMAPPPPPVPPPPMMPMGPGQMKGMSHFQPGSLPNSFSEFGAIPPPPLPPIMPGHVPGIPNAHMHRPTLAPLPAMHPAMHLPPLPSQQPIPQPPLPN